MSSLTQMHSFTRTTTQVQVKMHPSPTNEKETNSKVRDEHTTQSRLKNLLGAAAGYLHCKS